MQNFTKKDFFKALYSSANQEHYLEIRAINRKNKINKRFIKVSKIENKIDVIINNLNGKYNCYFGVALRKNEQNGGKNNCSELTALYVDIDYGQLGHKKQCLFANRSQVDKLLELYPIKPSIISNTGHGYQLYWLLKKPVALTNETIEDIEDLLKRLSISLGGDSTHNIDRLFRIPDTFNIKVDTNTRCEITELNTDLTYDIEHIRNHPILSLPFNKLNNDLLSMIFGVLPEDIDRSQFDEKIIYGLTKNQFNEAMISLVFDSYPTTGKYLERKKKDEKGANAYLRHSIEKSFNYYNTNVSNDNYQICQDDNNNPYYEDLRDRFYIVKQTQSIGYYYKDSSNKYNRLSNFIINIQEQVRDPKTNSCYITGSIVLEGYSREFSNISIQVLCSQKSFKEFVLNTAGVNAITYNVSMAIKAVQYHNIGTKSFELIDYGYDDSLTSYNTSELVITAESILRAENKIRITSQNIFDKLGFYYEEGANVRELLRSYELLIRMNKENVIIFALASLAMPLIYPYLKGANRVFLFFEGSSGCGKTTLLKVLNYICHKGFLINSCTSTMTSMSLKGYDLKDTVMFIDDVKLQNFQSEDERKKFMSFLQNYADETTRSRATADLNLKEDKPIRSILVLSGEDTVLSESSTLARGIYIPMEKLEMKKEFMNLEPKTFQPMNQAIPYLIQYIQNLGSDKINEMFRQIKDRLISQFNEVIYESANRMRLINNFAFVELAFEILYDFFASYQCHDILEGIYKNLDKHIKTLFDYNFKKVKEKRPEEKFIDTIFDRILINHDFVYFVDNEYSKLSPDTLMLVSINKNYKTYQIAFPKNAHKNIWAYLKEEGGIGHEYATVLSTLKQQNKAYTPEGGRLEVGLNDKKVTITGFVWKVELDPLIKSALGIPDDYKLVSNIREQKYYSRLHSSENSIDEENVGIFDMMPENQNCYNENIISF